MGEFIDADDSHLLKRFLPRAESLVDADRRHRVFPWRESRECMAEAIAEEFRAFRHEGIRAARLRFQEEGLSPSQRVRRKRWRDYALGLERDNAALVRKCNQLLEALGKPPMKSRDRGRPSFDDLEAVEAYARTQEQPHG